MNSQPTLATPRSSLLTRRSCGYSNTKQKKENLGNQKQLDTNDDIVVPNSEEEWSDSEVNPPQGYCNYVLNYTRKSKRDYRVAKKDSYRAITSIDTRNASKKITISKSQRKNKAPEDPDFNQCTQEKTMKELQKKIFSHTVTRLKQYKEALDYREQENIRLKEQLNKSLRNSLELEQKNKEVKEENTKLRSRNHTLRAKNTKLEKLYLRLKQKVQQHELEQLSSLANLV